MVFILNVKGLELVPSSPLGGVDLGNIWPSMWPPIILDS